MIKLFTLKKQEAEAGPQVPKVSPAQLRVQKGEVPASGSLRLDHSELSLPSYCKMEFDDVNDLMNFRLLLSPTDGLYAGGTFRFSFKVSIRLYLRSNED